jgi:alpha-amylase
MNLSENKKSKENQYVLLYFQVHQPRRLNPVSFFDLGSGPRYFNDDLNESIIQRVSRDCYVPANRLLLDLIRKLPEIRIAFSLSGTVIEQMERHAPEALESFRELARTGCVEFLAETYYHSLAGLVHTDEFEAQVLQHAEKIYEVFNLRPTVFRNTELIYNNEIGRRVAMMGFRGIFTEGHESALGSQSPHQLYCHPDEQHFRIFLRNYRLSDDIAFRFMEGGQALTLSRYQGWLDAMPPSERLINLAMDYETFGEHHKMHSGIFDFLTDLLTYLARNDRYKMVFPSEALKLLDGTKVLSVGRDLSWGDTERDISAWLGNEMQRDAFNSIMKLESEVKNLGNEQTSRYWRYLQTSDHFYYMSIKTDNDGSVHSYFSPFPSSYEAFINYMNVVTHLTYRINEEKNKPAPADDHDLSHREAERQSVRASTPVWVMNLESVPQGSIPDIER